MAAIVHCRLGAGAAGVSPWPEVARQAAELLRARGLLLRDAVVLVPYAALIEPVRAAFAAQPGWQPRVETTLTLAASLGPPDEVAPGQCSGDPALDRLQALQWLDGMPDDGRQIDRSHAAALLAEAAAAWVTAAALQPPAVRPAWHQSALATLPAAADGPGALESTLLRAAAAWASTAPAPVTDRLFSLQPAAWLVLRMGGADALADAVLRASACGGWLLDLDPPADEPFAPWIGLAQPQWCKVDDFEAEAMAAAAEVQHAVARGQGRVALVALDRALVRRVVALLQRTGVDIDDETGWKLSTTAAAGRVLARLRAALPGARGDDHLDWLRRWPPAERQARALQALEARWRGGRNAPVDAGDEAAAQALWAQARDRLAAWQAPGPRRLADWLALLRQQLLDDGDEALLAADEAGQRLWQALQAEAASGAWASVLRATRCDLAGFCSWFESLCETLTVQHGPRPGASVVLTPLARAVGRPFAHVVLAGADATRLGRDGGGPALVGDALAATLGLETALQRRERVRLALAQLLRAPGLTLLWRQRDGDATLALAPDLQWMQSRWERAGLTLSTQAARCERRAVLANPVPRPLPQAAEALPLALSASAVEALRQCPYRFFARSVLRLNEDDELDTPLRKRDYGDWLHATLHAFHRDRVDGQADLPALQRAADQALQALQLDPAAALAFRASLLQVLPAYLGWLAGHEADGWRWLAGEDALVAAPDDWAPQTLRGRIDRVDQGRGGVRLVLDYKTGAYDALRRRVKQPLEDTQLPFYTALLQAQAPGGEIQAAYLALDEADGPKLVPHEQVQATAERMLTELAAELQRLREGAPMPALGEGLTCETCEARGLCRRDDWPQDSPTDEPAAT